MLGTSLYLTGLYDQPLLGPKPDQLLIFKRPQLALKLQCLLQPATSAAVKHSNLSVVNQAIAAMYEHPALHDHVAGWAPVRSGQHNAEVHLSFKDASAQHRQQLASAGTIQLTMHAAAAPVSTVASKQLPDVTMAPAQANCPFSCCISPSQPQTISHLFLTCPVAATVTDWLCRLWQAPSVISRPISDSTTATHAM